MNATMKVINNMLEILCIFFNECICETGNLPFSFKEIKCNDMSHIFYSLVHRKFGKVL